MDEKFINRLLGAIEEHNLEGFDYLEYKQALQNLTNVEMDEETKYKSALAMAKTMGANSQNLIESANHYLEGLKTEEDKFLDAFRNQMSRHTDDNKNQLKSLELSISNKKKQIEQLQKEIEAESKALEEKRVNAEKSKLRSKLPKTVFIMLIT